MENIAINTDMGMTVVAPQPRAGGFVGRLRQDIETRKNEIKQENDRLEKEELKGKSYQKVLADLLEQFGRVDFRQKADLADGERLARRTLVVILIDEIIHKATSNNWGLCMKNGFIYLYNGRFWLPVNEDEFKPVPCTSSRKNGGRNSRCAIPPVQRRNVQAIRIGSEYAYPGARTRVYTYQFAKRNF